MILFNFPFHDKSPQNAPRSSTLLPCIFVYATLATEELNGFSSMTLASIAQYATCKGPSQYKNM